MSEHDCEHGFRGDGCPKCSIKLPAPTPRTDAEPKEIVAEEYPDEFYVKASFARTLERELADEKDKAANWMLEVDKRHKGKLAAAKDNLHRIQNEYEGMRTTKNEWVQRYDTLKAELAEAREAIERFMGWALERARDAEAEVERLRGLLLQVKDISQRLPGPAADFLWRQLNDDIDAALKETDNE